MSLLDDDRLHIYLDAGIIPVTVDDVIARASTIDEAGESGAADLEVVEPASPHPRGRWLFRAAAVVVVLGLLAGTIAFLLTRDGDEGTDPDEVDTVEEAPPAEASLLDDLLHTYEWRDVSAPPLQAREDAVSLWVGGHWVIWGGQVDGSGRVDGARYDPQVEEWSPMAEAPFPWSSGTRAAVVGDQAVVVDLGGPLAPSWAATYDPATDEWVRVDDPPLARSASDGEVDGWAGTVEGIHDVDGDAVVVATPTGGWAGGSQDPWVRTAVLDPGSGTWESLMGPPPLTAGDRPSAVLSVPTETGVRILARGTEPLAGSTPGSPLDPASPRLPSTAVPPTTPAPSEGFEPADLPAGPRQYAYFLDPDGRWLPLDQREAGQPLPPGLYAQPAPPISTLFPDNVLFDPETPYGPPTVADPVELAGTPAWPPFGHVVEDDGATRLIPPGPLTPEVVHDTGDLLLARSGGMVGGLGDADHPPIWYSGDWGVYDPAGDRWHHLSGGDGVAGERHDVAPGGDRGNDLLASVWTGDELFSWVAPPFSGVDLELPDGTTTRVDDDPFAVAYGPPPDRSGLDECEPDGDGQGGGPTTGDEPWQAVAGPSGLTEPAFAHPGALGGWLGAEARPGHAAALVDEQCALVGWWVHHRTGTLAAVTVEEYEALDFGWLAWQGEQERPTAGQVVDQVVLRDASDGALPGVYVVADPDWPEFETGRRPIPDGYPRWRPAGEMAPLGIAGLREGTIVGSDTDADGTYGRWADLEVGDVIQGGIQGGDLYEPGSPPRYDLMFVFEVVDRRTIPTADVEPLSPDDPPGLRLVIEHDDATATVVDARRWTDEDRQAEARESQAQGYADFDRRLATGELDAATEIAEALVQIERIGPVPGPEHDEAYHRHYAARLEEWETYIEIAERYLDE